MAATTQTLINSTTFTSLGAEPVAVQCLGSGAVNIVVAASLPAVGTLGFLLPGPPLNQPQVFGVTGGTNNVYAAMFNNPATIASNVIA